jgi:hypothetical protein
MSKYRYFTTEDAVVVVVDNSTKPQQDSFGKLRFNSKIINEIGEELYEYDIPIKYNYKVAVTTPEMMDKGIYDTYLILGSLP